MLTETLLDGFTVMLRIRTAEEAVAADFRANKIFSFLHLSTGQEAVAAGTCLALERQDKVFGTHRSHGHYLAKGGDLYRMLAEIYGKADGCAKGRGGSMHMLDRAAGFMGSTPILGSIVPIATGCAFAQKVMGHGAIVAVFFGDGASEEGVVYESLNLAALYKLPILFVLENNLYAVNTPESQRRPLDFSRKNLVQSLGVKYYRLDGNSFEEMQRATTELRGFVAANQPVFLEAITFRHRAHSGPIDDESARTEGDALAVRQQHDPIVHIRKSLRHRGITEDVLQMLEAAIAEEVATALQRARTAAEPSPVDLHKGLYFGH